MAKNLKLRRTVQAKVANPTYRALVQAAEQNDVSVSTFVRRLIEQSVAMPRSTERALERAVQTSSDQKVAA